jgi:hypothetical protein
VNTDNLECNAKMKQCSKCRQWKAKTDFHKNPLHRDGLHYWCKTCKSAYGRKPTDVRVRKYRTYEQRRRVVGGVRQKQCSNCSRWKAETEFYKSRITKDGLAYKCKRCADKATNECRRRRQSGK